MPSRIYSAFLKTILTITGNILRAGERLAHQPSRARCIRKCQNANDLSLEAVGLHAVASRSCLFRASLIRRYERVDVLIYQCAICLSSNIA